MLPVNAENVLRILVGRLGQVVPDDPRTFPTFGEVHEALSLEQVGRTIGQSLQKQGLELLGRWAIDEGLPAIDAIVVDRNTLLPGHGFFTLHGKKEEDFQWWIGQVAEVKEIDWAAYLEEGGSETRAVQEAMTLLNWLKIRTTGNGGAVMPFTTREAMAALGRTDFQKYARAHGNVQSLIDFACFRCGLPPLGLTSSTPFEKAWSTENRAWSYPVPQMRAAALARQWSETDFNTIRTTLLGLPGQAWRLWREAAEAPEEDLRSWAQSFLGIEMTAEAVEIREIEGSLRELLGKPGRRGGLAPGLTAGQRKAIETRAMVLSREALENEGWLVEDTSQNHPFDLRARRAETEMHVEVKGTTTPGESVVLTRGEVKHHLETQAVSALYIVSGIELTGTPETPEARGGLLRTWVPWSIDHTDLTPLAFEYSVPNPTN